MFGSGDRSLAASVGRTMSRHRGPCCCVEVFGCGHPACVKMAHKLDMTPNGAWSAWPVVVSTLAWILSLASVAACSFVTRSVSLKGSELDDAVAEKSLLLLHDHGVGFWGWESEGSCYSYTINGSDPSFDGAYKASNAFTTLTTLLGGIGMMYCWLGTCFLVKPTRYEQIGYLFLLTAVFCASTLVTMASNLCKPAFFSYAVPGTNLADLMSTSCGMGSGSILSLIAAIFYVAAAIICLRSPLASKSRTSGGLREIDPALGKQYQDEGLDDEEEDYDEDRERLRREEETQRRYRDMFGEEEEGEEEEDDYYQTDGGKGFQPSLGQVEEEDYDDEEYQSERGSRRSARNPFDDERSRGSRSRYSQDSREAPRSQYARSERSRSHRGGNTSDEQSFYSEEERSQYSGEEGSRHSSRRSRRSREDERYEDERSYYSRSQRDTDDGQSFASQSQHSEIV